MIRTRLAEVHPAIVARLERPAENAYLNQLRLPRAIAEVGGVFADRVGADRGGRAVQPHDATPSAAGGTSSAFAPRSALRRDRSVRLVLRDGTAVVGAGVAAGLLGGWLVGRSLAAFHYGVTAADPVTWAGGARPRLP